MLSSPIILKNLVALTNKTQKKKKKKKKNEERKKEEEEEEVIISKDNKIQCNYVFEFNWKPKVLYLCFTSMNIS